MKRTLMICTVLTALTLPGIAVAADPAPAASTAATPATGAAPAKPTLTVGTKVYGPQGDEVGTIETVAGDNIVINTGANKATLASASFASGDKGPVIGMSKAQLDAAVQQATAQASAAKDAALVPGAEVKSKDGVLVGKIEKVEGDNVVVARSEGPVTLNRSHLTTGPTGGLSLVMTAAEFEAAAKAASASAGAGTKKEG